MGVLQANKFKIFAGSGVVIGTGACVTIPFLSSEAQVEDNNMKEKEPVAEGVPREQEQPKVPKEPQPEVPVKIEVPTIPNHNPQGREGESISVKLTTLKSKKLTLSNQVSQNITTYRGFINESKFIAQMDQEWKSCKSKDEVVLGITEEEKNSLKNSYTEVKKDFHEYESIQKEIESDLTQKESYADQNQDDENRYVDFERKFNEVNEKYKNIGDKKSHEALVRNYKSMYDKLNKANEQCSFKDLIKLNEWLVKVNYSDK